MEFGIPTVVVAAVQVRATVIIAAQVVVIMRADLDNVVVQMFDYPSRFRMADCFEPQIPARAMSCQGFDVDAQLDVLVPSRRPNLLGESRNQSRGCALLVATLWWRLTALLGREPLKGKAALRDAKPCWGYCLCWFACWHHCSGHLEVQNKIPPSI